MRLGRNQPTFAPFRLAHCFLSGIFQLDRSNQNYLIFIIIREIPLIKHISCTYHADAVCTDIYVIVFGIVPDGTRDIVW